MPIPDTPAPMIATPRRPQHTRSVDTVGLSGLGQHAPTVKTGSPIVIHQTANRTGRLNQ